jgi:PRTRC genetic system protein B
MTMKNLLPVFPQLQWNDRDYTNLKARLLLFEDFLVMEKVEDGQPREMYLVDPLDIAARMGGAIGISSGILPANCLMWSWVDGQARIAVYVEPKIWAVSVEGNKGTWHIPMPGLVVVGQDRTYHFYAVKESGWPGPETALYAAPCPNLGSKGVCVGDAPFPVASAETMGQAVKVFFESGFNNHLDNNKSLKYPKSVLTQWQKLHHNKTAIYPVDDLVEIEVPIDSAYTWKKRPMTVADIAQLKVQDKQ